MHQKPTQDFVTLLDRFPLLTFFPPIFRNYSSLLQVKKSGVDAGHTREGQNEDFSLGFELGAHMREAVNINLGLLALKKCIEGTPADTFFVD